MEAKLPLPIPFKTLILKIPAIGNTKFIENIQSYLMEIKH